MPSLVFRFPFWRKEKKKNEEKPHTHIEFQETLQNILDISKLTPPKDLVFQNLYESSAWAILKFAQSALLLDPLIHFFFFWVENLMIWILATRNRLNRLGNCESILTMSPKYLLLLKTAIADQFYRAFIGIVAHDIYLVLIFVTRSHVV